MDDPDELRNRMQARVLRTTGIRGSEKNAMLRQIYAAHSQGYFRLKELALNWGMRDLVYPRAF